ncbi:MAG: sn-glycerol-3-phosphate ABC transporter ATP-binding protein UgpC, partial [Microvirga sp.]
MAAVVLKDLRKSFGSTEVIHGVSMHIDDGEFVVFVGPSGCGKSTLLRLIAGIEEITDGELLIDGVVVNDRLPKERGIAMVFQSYALYPHMNAYDNMAFGLELSKLSRREIDLRVRRVAGMLQMEELLDRKPRDLSGGQRQRVAIGRAIVRDPKVFLFDEPLSNLDASLRVQTRIEIAGLHRQTGATMIYVTHDQVEAMTLAQKIVVLNAGRVEQIGAPLDLYHRPKNLFVAGFLGSPQMNFWKSEVRPGGAGDIMLRDPMGVDMEMRLGTDELRPGDTVTVGIRPEHVVIGTKDGAGGRIELVEQLGESHLLYVRTQELLMTVRAPGDSRHS